MHLWDTTNNLKWVSHYDPGIGRFLTEDSDAGRLGSPKTFNTKYVYASGNPISYTDPLGIFSVFNNLGVSAQLLAGSAWRGTVDFLNKNQTEIIAAGVIIGALTIGSPVAVAGLVAGSVSAGFSMYNGGSSKQIAKNFIGGFAAGALGAAFGALGASFGSTLGSRVALGVGTGMLGGFVGVNVGTQIAYNRWANGTESSFGILGGGLGGLMSAATFGQSGVGVGIANGSVDTSTNTAGSATGSDYVPQQ